MKRSKKKIFLLSAPVISTTALEQQKDNDLKEESGERGRMKEIKSFMQV